MTRARPEEQAHKAILAYLRLRFPRAVIVHAANELPLRADAKSKAIAQNRAKSLGMLPGFPDLVAFVGDGSGEPGTAEALAFEIKSATGRLSADQAAVLERLRLIGVRCAVVRSVAEVEEALEAWGLT